MQRVKMGNVYGNSCGKNHVSSSTNQSWFRYGSKWRFSSKFQGINYEFKPPKIKHPTNLRFSSFVFIFFILCFHVWSRGRYFSVKNRTLKGSYFSVARQAVTLISLISLIATSCVGQSSRYTDPTSNFGTLVVSSGPGTYHDHLREIKHPVTCCPSMRTPTVVVLSPRDFQWISMKLMFFQEIPGDINHYITISSWYHHEIPRGFPCYPIEFPQVHGRHQHVAFGTLPSPALGKFLRRGGNPQMGRWETLRKTWEKGGVKHGKMM